MSPNTAFLLFCVGILGIYAEFLRPGSVLPGLVGSILAIAGSYSLLHAPLTRNGLILLVLAIFLLLAEAAWQAHFIPGALGTACLAAGFVSLVRPPRQVAPAFAIPGALVLGTITTYLAWSARRARQNKASDL